MKKNKLKAVASVVLMSMLLNQTYMFPELLDHSEYVLAAEANEGETAESVIAAAKKELENRKAKKRIILEDGHQGFYEQYLIGANAAIDTLNSVVQEPHQSKTLNKK